MKTAAHTLQALWIDVQAESYRRGVKVQIPDSATLYSISKGRRPWREIYSCDSGFGAPGAFFRLYGVEVRDDHVVIHVCKGRRHQRRHLTVYVALDTVINWRRT